MAVGAASMAGARLDRLPICSFHYRLLALIGAGMFLDAFDIYLQGPVLAELVHIKWSTPVGNATFISVTFAGLFLGTLLSGWLGDRFGRRATYQFNLLVFGLGSLVAALSPNFTFLLVCRLIAGIGMGGEVVTGYSTLSEFVPARRRGRWQGYLAVITNVGLPASAFVSLAVIPSFGWRWMFVIAGVCALIVWVMRKSMPESPRWCEIRGRQAEADAVLAKVEAAVQKATGEPLAPVSIAREEAPKSATPTLGAGSLLHGALLRRTILGALLMICLNVGAYAFLTWIPTILLTTGSAIGGALLLTSLMQIGSIPGALIGAWASESGGGRRRSIIVFSILSTVFAVVFAFVHSPVAMVVIGFVLILVTYAQTALIFGAYVPELFPTEVRMRGSGVCNALSRLGNVFAPYGVAFLLIAAGPTVVFIVVGAVLLINAIAAAVLGEETRGKSLEVIGEVAVAAA